MNYSFAVKNDNGDGICFLWAWVLGFSVSYLTGCCYARLIPWQRERIPFKEQSQLQILLVFLINKCQVTEYCMRLRLFLA